MSTMNDGQGSGNFPAKQGMYDPQFEHDACGVGMVVNMRGVKSHDVVTKALQILCNLTHRGACGCDETTGDGAGILMQMPDEFMRAKAKELNINLPAAGEYATGLIFLPRKADEQKVCMDLFEKVVKDEGQVFLGWRNVPQNGKFLGDIARTVEPDIHQIFIAKGAGVKDQAHFERKIFVIRKVMEKAVRELALSEKNYFYVPSLSSRTIVYKGLMLAEQIEPFLVDLSDPLMKSAIALVHQRYSTNTFPTWDLAHPFRFICHNGEINTLRGNVNWMTAREALFKSEIFGDDIKKLLPIITPGCSDSQAFDNAVELLLHTGRSLPHALMMLIPEAWQNHETMEDDRKAFYEYHSCMMEPWDGPASICFTDGNCVGALLDRNGLRPSRYTVTKDGFVIMGSETGVLPIDPANVEYKGRLQPGKMFLIDIEQGRIVSDDELKGEIAKRQPYREWLNAGLIKLNDQPEQKVEHPTHDCLTTQQQLFGYTLEDLRIVMQPMAKTGIEATGSMGVDVPIAVLSDRSQLLYNYFKQLFAQVTNPPLDAIREELVTSMITNIGRGGDLFRETADHCKQLRIDNPVLTNEDLQKIRSLKQEHLKAATLPMLFDPATDGEGLKKAMDEVCAAAEKAIAEGASILILSDRGAGKGKAPIPALMACAGVHHHLVRVGKRSRCGLVIESGEPREVHHFATLFGYGASAINPYLAFDTLADMVRDQRLTDIDLKKAEKNFIKAATKGVLKVMSKMGISTLQSYKGAQQFEAIGLNKDVIDRYFTWTPSRIAGIGIAEIAKEVKLRHDFAFPALDVPANLELDIGGIYQWRRTGEHHLLSPLIIAKLQEAARENKIKTYEDYANLVNDQSKKLGTLRGLIDFNFDPAKAIPLDEVEPWTEIVKRFKTGAMSYGSISKEAHETLAIAMNRIGGKSNSGEGGEDADRFTRDANGDWRNSAIKQVASGRFGVTSHYLSSALELQIKMAQGAKPGEGGQLPGEKVYPWVAKTRHSTPYVQLISPPPHHDIYSIEDLAQLIHDLKNSNPSARVSVKLVSEVGVGTVAAGVSKGKADVVLISGYDGGTGASPETSLKHAGLPWELGLSETHQTLVLNNLRSRIVVECDGKLLTGRDVAIAALLGAEEFGFSTAPLITVGCIMMRVCHLNTCPVGIATQDPELRAKFNGKPEYVINFMHFIAEELRGIMAKLGYRKLTDMVGQSDRLGTQKAINHWKAKGLDYTAILHRPQVSCDVGLYCTQKQNHNLDKSLDNVLIEKSKAALERGEKVEFTQEIRNVNRTVGTTLSYNISKRYGEAGLPEDTIVINAKGSGGQSFCAFGASGLTVKVEGDSNDYFGKGLSGAKLVIVPPKEATFVPEQNILIGNVALYGAIKGEAYIRGLAGERFAVRNSGARTVVEGVGDHGCEYMTGGRVVVIGPTGRNFAAGMSGGVAYVLDEDGSFVKLRLNKELVAPETPGEADEAELRDLIQKHFNYTKSTVAKRILDNWETIRTKFVKIMPVDYKKALERIAKENAAKQELVGAK